MNDARHPIVTSTGSAASSSTGAPSSSGRCCSRSCSPVAARRRCSRSSSAMRSRCHSSRSRRLRHCHAMPPRWRGSNNSRRPPPRARPTAPTSTATAGASAGKRASASRARAMRRRQRHVPSSSSRVQRPRMQRASPCATRPGRGLAGRPIRLTACRAAIPTLASCEGPLAELIGVETLSAAELLVPGRHEATILAGVVLTPDTSKPYVIIVGDSAGETSQTYFHKWTMGVIVHGYAFRLALSIASLTATTEDIVRQAVHGDEGLEDWQAPMVQTLKSSLLLRRGNLRCGLALRQHPGDGLAVDRARPRTLRRDCAACHQHDAPARGRCGRPAPDRTQPGHGRHQRDAERMEADGRASR